MPLTKTNTTVQFFLERGGESCFLAFKTRSLSTKQSDSLKITRNRQADVKRLKAKAQADVKRLKAKAVDGGCRGR